MAKRGRPQKATTHDPEAAKEFIEKFFLLVAEQKGLQQERKDLKEQYSDKIDMKLVGDVIRLVKAELKITASPETVEEMSLMIKDKIGKIM